MTLWEALWLIWRSSRAVNYHIISCSLTVNPSFIHLSVLSVPLCGGFSVIQIDSSTRLAAASPHLWGWSSLFWGPHTWKICVQVIPPKFEVNSRSWDFRFVLQVLGGLDEILIQPTFISCRPFPGALLRNNVCCIIKSLTFSSCSPIISQPQPVPMCVVIISIYSQSKEGIKW